MCIPIIDILTLAFSHVIFVNVLISPNKLPNIFYFSSAVLTVLSAFKVDQTFGIVIIFYVLVLIFIANRYRNKNRK